MDVPSCALVENRTRNLAAGAACSPQLCPIRLLFAFANPLPGSFLDFGVAGVRRESLCRCSQLPGRVGRFFFFFFFFFFRFFLDFSFDASMGARCTVRRSCSSALASASFVLLRLCQFLVLVLTPEISFSGPNRGVRLIVEERWKR